MNKKRVNIQKKEIDHVEQIRVNNEVNKQQMII